MTKKHGAGCPVFFCLKEKVPRRGRVWQKKIGKIEKNDKEKGE